MNKDIMKDKDRELWLEFIKEVKPIEKNIIKSEKKFKTRISKTNIGDEENTDTFNYFEADHTENICERIPDMNILKKIRKGRLRVESKLDVHGLKYKESHEKVFDFIISSYANRKRVLLIITGKGERLGIENGWKGQGILKQSLPRWLSNKAFEEKISWFNVAPPNYGGNGAYIVYLKKLRG